MKRLIVCFDGTWNAADSEKSETNVARLARCIRANSRGPGQSEPDVPQMVLYLRGVGTSGTGLQRLIAGATGIGVEDNIRSAYMFLAQNYVPEHKSETGKTEPADEIYLFGFSRGAFSARSLAGFIAACGLLKRQKLGDVHAAWRYYSQRSKRSPEDFIARYKTDAHRDVAVTFLGIWDTVGALGIPVGLFGTISEEMHAFHDTSPARIVRYGAHALAVDEQRDEFVPTLWTGTPSPDSVIQQVWFAGCHSDVGGGYADRALAEIPLHWMADRAEDQGLRFDRSIGILQPRGTRFLPPGPTHESRQGWSVKDRLTPTIRRICEQDVAVSLFERLHVPRDRSGKILRTIGEGVHDSVLQRLNTLALTSPEDKPSRRRKALYEPKNQMALLDAQGRLKPGIPVVT